MYAYLYKFLTGTYSVFKKERIINLLLIEGA